MKKRKKGYGILLGSTVFFALLGLITVIPVASGPKVSILGYKTFCSFSPWSTLMLLLTAGSICLFRKKKFTYEE